MKPLSGPLLFERKHSSAGCCGTPAPGHDVLTSLDAGRANASVPDLEVLAFAAAENRILLSHNRRHFLHLHRHRTVDHAGIVLCTLDPDFSRQAQRIHEAITTTSEMLNQLIRVNRPG